MIITDYFFQVKIVKKLTKTYVFCKQTIIISVSVDQVYVLFIHDNKLNKNKTAIFEK